MGLRKPTIGVLPFGPRAASWPLERSTQLVRGRGRQGSASVAAQSSDGHPACTAVRLAAFPLGSELRVRARADGGLGTLGDWKRLHATSPRQPVERPTAFPHPLIQFCSSFLGLLLGLNDFRNHLGSVPIQPDHLAR
jgi:hypothetical protein